MWIVKNIYSNFASKDELLKKLTETNGYLSLLKKNRITGECEEVKEYSNYTYLPNIQEVIENLGYQTHSFDECLELYKDIFENDDDYLPFDDDELYITKDDKYEGCCTKDGFEFLIKNYHFYWAVIEK